MWRRCSELYTLRLPVEAAPLLHEGSSSSSSSRRRRRRRRRRSDWRAAPRQARAGSAARERAGTSCPRRRSAWRRIDHPHVSDCRDSRRYELRVFAGTKLEALRAFRGAGARRLTVRASDCILGRWTISPPMSTSARSRAPRSSRSARREHATRRRCCATSTSRGSTNAEVLLVEDLLAAIDLVRERERTFLVQCSAHVQVHLVTERHFREVFVLDTFIHPTKELALLVRTRRRRADEPRDRLGDPRLHRPRALEHDRRRAVQASRRSPPARRRLRRRPHAPAPCR